ncbi:MAG: pyrroloquinoline quinone biosynthesis peptide chaperone PqqD [Gemmatimonadetes bacterium]|nr:pyrroloquinoline quinone biosynthesis peptide chaperone PqqD [Gemmatimonadota bacterium]
MWSDQDRPRLARGVRLRWDPVRETQMLLRPEGAVALNPSAAAVLELCEGQRSVGGIIEELQTRHPGVDLGNDVRELLASLAELGLVIHADR